jgi:hypothetical protein
MQDIFNISRTTLFVEEREHVLPQRGLNIGVSVLNRYNMPPIAP